MRQIKIGNTNFSASAIAFGIMRMNKLSVDEAVKALETAHDTGINFIDSSDIYGHGKSEEIFGEALEKSSLSRDDFYIQSKTGIFEDESQNYKTTRYDFSKEHIIKSVDGILSRMKIDYLDSLLLHRPDALMDPAEIAAAFDELQKDGKVRHFGVSNFNPMQVELLQAGLSQKLLINQLQLSVMHTGPIDFNIHTNMTDARSIDHDRGVLDYSRLHNMTVQAWSPFQYGQIEGNFIGNPKFPEVNDALQKLADKKGVSKNAIAAAWILRHPAIGQVIIGTMTPEHIVDSAKGADISLTAQEWYDIYLAAGNDLP
ncbi:aldo/keto reductase [Lactobacillus sp. M0403]|uniref:aldo/keto reductase n=1 Tax=unclassified Lactobacillus TaxID=2620435 RepID=UPI000EFB90FC|nr:MULTISPECIES: aldo/keto reductase [unclassified Lactobacillus]MBI0093481.1 aldo/keto reductase [Lactobacillus sp. M0403]MCT6890956.1 aldo/keto reductase [Lactobacillus sp.]RMC51500.1 aldo/keto reductase [Lactobacillus sp. ESL0263]